MTCGNCLSPCIECKSYTECTRCEENGKLFLEN